MTYDNRDALIERMHDALCEAIAGPDAAEMSRAYARGEPLRTIAARHGTSRSAAHRRIVKLRATLAERGLLPNDWRRVG